MRWKIVSRVAKRTHEQFRVEVYLRVGVQTRRARFTPHRFVRDNLRRANERERERERNKKREKKSTSEYPHRSLVRERERNRRRRRRVRIRLARTTTKQSISKINPFLSQRRIQKPNRCRADRRAPPSKTPREATAPPSQNKKSEIRIVRVIIRSSSSIVVRRRLLSSKTHRYVLDRFQRRHQGTQRQDAFLRRLAIVRPTVERKPNAVGVLQVGPRHRRRHVGIHHDSGLLFF